MQNHSFFFSLRWKLAILVGSVFLVLLSVFAYLSYLNALDNFENDRKRIQQSHAAITETLTEDSFLVLEQFAELLSVAKNSAIKNASDNPRNLEAIDENWSKWQLIWDMENISFFDNQGVRVKSWGEPLSGSDAAAKHVLKSEAPVHQIYCPDNCFQQAMVPVLEQAKIIGVFSVIRPFTDVIIKYKNAAGSDVGILIPDNTASAKDRRVWPYKLSAMTEPKKNTLVFEYVARNFPIEDLLNARKRVTVDKSVYEVQLLPIQQIDMAASPPFFFFVDEITDDLSRLNADVKRIWSYGLLGLLAALSFIIVTLHVSLRRIGRLSTALPLLSKNDLGEFKKQLSTSDSFGMGYDELDTLAHAALGVSDQLGVLEQKMHNHTFSLLEKSQELAKERDFIKQLFELAPIIIIIQNINGIILKINHAGSDELEAPDNAAVGKVFDLFIPESDQEHLKKLNRLRSGKNGDLVQLDGSLVTQSGKLRDISWLHKVLPSKHNAHELIILSLGMDISERKISEARNIRMAYYDYLTGLGNRRKFNEEFAQKLASAERYGYQLALFYLDLDSFKEINDTCGHDAGDGFLKSVANALKGAIRSTDLICRLGGDEFIMLMPHADLAGVEHIAKKINHVLKEQNFNVAGRNHIASASIGVAVYPVHGTTVSDLITHADLAMYRAKELGRGQYHLFDADFDYRSKSNQAVRWRNILEDAIEQDRFVLFYQPILTISTNEISHFECLVRLQKDDGTLIMPSEFVMQAEELGLISKIDRIVLKKALRQHIEFNRQGKPYKLSVNISRRTFDDLTVFNDFSELFNNPEVDPKRIIFEITDSSAVTSYQSTNYLINRIKDLGCVLALNDFGVEYPSLHYLKNAPVDYVKIDGSLIRQIDKNNDDRVFVKALADVAQAFGKKTVAEFVENEAVLVILKEFGIDYAQGYHIGKPKAIE